LGYKTGLTRQFFAYAALMKTAVLFFLCVTSSILSQTTGTSGKKLTGQQKALYEARQREIARRKAEAKALGKHAESLITDNAEHNKKVLEWLDNALKGSVTVGMPERFAEYALDGRFDRNSSSDGTQVWHALSLIVILHDGKVTKWYKSE
jgi:hypothetical protein